MSGYYFFPRLADGDNPAGVTVSKTKALPAGEFSLSEYIWGPIHLWFIDAQNFTEDERQAAYHAFCGWTVNWKHDAV